MNLKQTPLKLELSGRPIYLVDGWIDEATICRVHTRFSTLKFARTESDRDDTKHVKTLVANLDQEVLATEPLLGALAILVMQLFPGERLAPYRAYVNCYIYGDDAYPHRDCSSDRDDVTVLYYANKEWSQAFGGETIFFNDEGDARIAIGPRPGRIVVFRGAIEHRSGIPSRGCPLQRLTLAYKFSVRTD